MKNILVAIIILFFAREVKAGAGDTAYYRRPYYLGVSAGYTAYTNGILAGSPRPVVVPQNPYYDRMAYWGASYGLVAAFPFARKMECELGLDGNFTRGWESNITDVAKDPETMRPIGYSFNTHYVRYHTANFRLQFGYELFRGNKFALNAGIEAWGAFINTRHLTNGGGLNAVVKTYLPVSHGNAAIQIAGIFGLTHTGTYVGVRASYCLTAMRIYRHKPRHYYVRTYED